MRRTLLATLFFVALVSIWHFIVQANIWSPVLLPSPTSVGEYLLGAARDGTLLQATTVTVRRLLVGYFIGIAIDVRRYSIAKMAQRDLHHRFAPMDGAPTAAE